MPRKPIRVSFQGELGAFSHMAIRQLLGPRAEALPFPQFEKIFRAVTEGEADAAMVPVENTLHGSVHENYDHLVRFPIPIVAETSVRIVHNLIAPPGVRFRDVKRVFSHPVALNQCLDFFAANPAIEKCVYYDTAGSVKMVATEKPPGGAAIASALAAELYGCRILRKSIEDDRENFTRFVLVSANAGLAPPATRGYKTSVVFTLRNMPGSLFRALSGLAIRDINLDKIESRPLRGKPWEYLFYLDFLGHASEERVRNALRHLEEFADMFRVLGSYPRAHR